MNRRAAWITVAAALAAFAILAGALVPWDPVPGGQLRQAAPLDVFTAEQIARAQEYASVRRYLAWGSLAVSLLVAAALGFTPLGARLVGRLVGGRSRWIAVPVAVLAVLVVGRLATLPFSVLIRQRSLDYGLTEQSWPAWGVDVVKSLGVSWALTTLVFLVAIALARRAPRTWFAWAGGVAAALAFAGSFLYPVLLEPVFNDFEPLPAGELRTAVFELAEEQGVDIDEVLVADASRRTTTLNAYVSGLGGTRRVVLYDNLVEGLAVDEARVVVAHELAHADHNDVLLGTTLGAIGGVLGVALLALVLDSRRVRRRAGVASVTDPTVVPLVLALAAFATLIASPVQSSISRAIEFRADREALAATGDPAMFVTMQRELAVAALSDPTPPAWSHFWFGTHPTVLQRAGLPASLARAEAP